MKTMICLAVFAVTMSVAYAAINAHCSEVADCGDAANWQCWKKTGCVNGTCACKTGMAGTACDKLVDGEECTVATDPTECHESTSTCVASEADPTKGKCTPPCLDNKVYNWESLACMAADVEFKKAGEACTTDAECLGGRAESDAVPMCDTTTTNMCKCGDGLEATSDNLRCLKLDYDDTCAAPGDCQSGVCTAEKCACAANQERYENTCVATGAVRNVEENGVCMLDNSKTCAADLACCPVAASDPVSYVCMDEEDEGGNNTSGASAVSAVLFTIASAIMALLF